LSTVAGHEADAIYIAALTRDAFGPVRAAALALDRTPKPDAAIPALKSALQRIEDDGRPGAVDARLALRSTLGKLGVALRTPKPTAQPPATLDPAELRRLKAPRARFTIRDVGQFDLALLTMEAPTTVLHFVRLAQTGYYNGLTFHRVAPNTMVRGGSTAANDFSGDGPLTRDEVGLWPHVRGALGVPNRGRDTGDARFFIDLVDNPRYDHTYTVFAQVLNGLDIVDRLIEGDVIETIEILP
jgi:peptidyl-prolyl cis-trans isomerase B (cyclophilin B)